jgi:hypothetical protein
MDKIKHLVGLRKLWLFQTSITDAGLDALKGLTGLKELGIPKTISPKGIELLKKQRPSTRIVQIEK